MYMCKNVRNYLLVEMYILLETVTMNNLPVSAAINASGASSTSPTLQEKSNCY